MTTYPRYTRFRERAGALGEIVLGLGLIAGALYLLYLVRYWSNHGVSIHWHDLFVLLHHYGVKWLVAVAGIGFGIGLCLQAWKRFRSWSTAEEDFTPGTMPLESSQWMSALKKKKPAEPTPEEELNWETDRLP